MRNNNNEDNLVKCRNCYYEVENGIKRCQYCGVLNPTLKLKDIFITIFFVLFVMAIYTYLIK
jgi:hypothetical protein